MGSLGDISIGDVGRALGRYRPVAFTVLAILVALVAVSIGGLMGCVPVGAMLSLEQVSAAVMEMRRNCGPGRSPRPAQCRIGTKFTVAGCLRRDHRKVRAPPRREEQE